MRYYSLRFKIWLPKTVSQEIVSRLKKLIFNNSQTHISIFWHLEKNHPAARKVTHAYYHANLEVEGRGEEKKYRTRFLMQIYKREIKHKGG